MKDELLTCDKSNCSDTTQGFFVSTTKFPHHPLHRAGLLLIVLFYATAAWADMPLSERYQRLKSGADVTLPGTTISLASSEQKGLVSADVNTILPYPFDKVAPTLAKAQNWCQFMPLHFNIKACTCEPREKGEILTLYSGRKTYQPPEDSFALAYHFEVAQQEVGQLLLHLHAESGPAGTRDYVIEVGALKVKEGTLLHVHLSYRTSITSSLLTRGYLSTIGRDKIGFTHITKDGKSYPVQGVRGVIERNVMRYQLAIVAYLSTQSLPAASRHEAELTKWFKQNDSFPQQLHEMTEKEYLEIKHKEWDNQQKLQQALSKHCS